LTIREFREIIVSAVRAGWTGSPELFENQIAFPISRIRDRLPKIPDFLALTSFF
jgi:hypothetical protein